MSSCKLHLQHKGFIAMRLSFQQVLNWIDDQAKDCTAAQLNMLMQKLEAAKREAAQRDEQVERVRQQMSEMAKSLGLESPAELMKFIKPGAVEAAPKTKFIRQGSRVPRTSIRKPYMDPFDPQSDIHALPHMHPLLPWAQRCIDQGWSKEELHYKRIKAAWQARGLPELYDPIERHAALIAAELADGTMLEGNNA